MKTRTGRLFVALGLVCALLGMVSRDAWAEKKIGVLIWSEEPRYAESNNGLLEQLKKEGFAEPAVRFIVENAGGNKAKASELARKLAAAKPDMVTTHGTSATVAVAKEISDVPIVFSMVYDPVESKIAEDWKSSHNNTTGASPKVPMPKLLEALKKLAPIKTLAVLYTPGEKNSESQLKEAQAAQGALQIKVVPVPLSSKDDVSSVVADAAERVNAMYLTGSNVVGEHLSQIVNIATKAKVITVSHLDDIVEKGALLGVCANSRDVGRLAGEKAAKVLKGAKPASIPIETLKKLDVIVNMKTAKAAGIEVPSAFLKTATRVIE